MQEFTVRTVIEYYDPQRDICDQVIYYKDTQKEALEQFHQDFPHCVIGFCDVDFV